MCWQEAKLLILFGFGILWEANCSTSKNCHYGTRDCSVWLGSKTDFLPNILEERDWKAGTHGWAYRRLWAVSPTFHHSTLQNSASLPTMGLNFSKQFLKQSVCRLLQEQRWEKGTLTMPLSVICADPWTSGSSRPRLSNNLGTWMKKPTSQINMIVLYPHVT